MTGSSSSLQDLYLEKASSYFDVARVELLAFVPKKVETALDVGCGTAAFSVLLKRERNAEVWGVELNAEAAAQAKGRLDRVVGGHFSPDLDLPLGYFDLICFNDVLEHLPDPGAALRQAKTLLKPDGRILASIPNFRHFPTLWNLVVRKTAKYEDYGIMDRTHLRIFTESSIRLLFAEADLVVEQLQGINGQFVDWRFFLWNRLTMGSISDAQWLQFAVVARLKENGG